MIDLSQSLALSPDDRGFTAHADPRFEANSGMYGGWTAALIAKAALTAPGAEGALSALTVNYINRIAPGSALRLQVQQLGASKSIAHWRADLYADDHKDAAAVGAIVLTNRKPTDARTDIPMPAAPTPDALESFAPPGPFGAHVDIRQISGQGIFNQPAHSLSWERILTDAPLEAAHLAILADLGWPRAWALGDGQRLSSTITLSLYVHATDEDLAAVGRDFVLSEMSATRAAQATIGSRKDMWSRAGALLATSEQLCWFR